MLMDEETARAAIRNRIASRDWWIVPWFGRNAGVFCTLIEDRYFDGRHAAGCEVHIGRVAVAFFAKKRLTVPRLVRAMKECGCPEDVAALTAALADHDVLMLDPEAEQLAPAWHDWVMGRTPGGKA
jgi:hypothetical protein